MKLIRFYTITSELGNMIYIGSTEMTVNERFKCHKGTYSQYKRGKYHFVTSFALFDEYGAENCRIAELSNQICKKTERDKIEAQYIQQYKQDVNFSCTNRCIPGRTDKQYKTDNNEKRKEQGKQYRLENLVEIREKKKQFYNNNKMKIVEQHMKYVKENKEKIDRWRKQKCVCDKCGKTFRRSNKSSHDRCKFHINFTININISGANDKTNVDMIVETANQIVEQINMAMHDK